MEGHFFVKWKIKAFFFEGLEDFVSEIEIVDHAMMIWTEAN
jgi:hypothetical protein